MTDFRLWRSKTGLERVHLRRPFRHEAFPFEEWHILGWKTRGGKKERQSVRWTVSYFLLFTFSYRHLYIRFRTVSETRHQITTFQNEWTLRSILCLNFRMQALELAASLLFPYLVTVLATGWDNDLWSLVFNRWLPSIITQTNRNKG